MKYLWCYETPIGRLTLVEENGCVCHLLLNGQLPPPGCEPGETDLLASVATQLAEYFAGQRKSFDFPFVLRGTPFQETVWQALQTIPYGETRSYLEIARQIERSTAARAVGMACARNPLPVIVPCHRVVGSNGCLTGYAGGQATKQLLLAAEQSCRTDSHPSSIRYVTN